MDYTLENLFGMTGRTVIVVGGTSGIGLEIARALLDLGAQVAVVGRTSQKCLDAQRMLSQKDPSVRAYQADVVDETALADCFAAVNSAYGKIDGLVYSAGINHIEGLDTIAQEDFDRVMDVNFKGMVLSCKLAGKYMMENGFGTIVNISSLSAVRGKAQYTAYAASKSAIHGFTRALGVEWIRKGIRVNCVSRVWLLQILIAGRLKPIRKTLKGGWRRSRAAARGRPPL